MIAEAARRRRAARPTASAVQAPMRRRRAQARERERRRVRRSSPRRPKRIAPDRERTTNPPSRPEDAADAGQDREDRDPGRAGAGAGVAAGGDQLVDAAAGGGRRSGCRRRRGDPAPARPAAVSDLRVSDRSSDLCLPRLISGRLRPAALGPNPILASDARLTSPIRADRSASAHQFIGQQVHQQGVDPVARRASAGTPA